MSINLHYISETEIKCGWKLEPGRPVRDWFSNHVYRCDPLLDANRSTLSMILTEDIDVDWNGKSDPSDVTVYKGSAMPKVWLRIIYSRTILDMEDTFRSSNSFGSSPEF